jgi:hypothetical protein
MNRQERRAHLSTPLPEREPTFDLAVGLLAVRWTDERREVVRRWGLALDRHGDVWTSGAPLLTLEPGIPLAARVQFRGERIDSVALEGSPVFPAESGEVDSWAACVAPALASFVARCGAVYVACEREGSTPAHGGDLATLAEGDIDRFAAPGGATIEVTVVWDWPHFTLTLRPPR